MTGLQIYSVRVWARSRLKSMSGFMAMIRVTGMIREWGRSKIRLCSRPIRARIGLVRVRPMEIDLGLFVPLALGFG